MPDKNQLYYGDNLTVLRDYIRDESVDLIYLDPPFNSRADYNVLFAEKDGTRSSSQITAFEDTWEWNIDAEHAYQSVVEGGGRVAEAMRAFRTFLGTSDMMAYLAMMAPRLMELRRVLKVTGSIYLHCDPTASHYLKILMDGIFGPVNLLNEIVWKRTGAHGSAKRYGPVHDVLLFYRKTDAYIWNNQYLSQDDYIRERYTYKDDSGRMFYPVSLVGAGVRHGSSGEQWRGIDVTSTGNHWRYTIDKLEELDAKGDIYWPSKGGKPRLKMTRVMRKELSFKIGGGIYLRSIPKQLNVLVIPHRSPKPFSNASSKPVPMKATLFSIPSADAAPQSPLRRASNAAGSELM
jgi:adenine specific DNA methylase Mod